MSLFKSEETVIYFYFPCLDALKSLEQRRTEADREQSAPPIRSALGKSGGAGRGGALD